MATAVDYSDLTIVRCSREQAEQAIANSHDAWGAPNNVPIDVYRQYFRGITLDAAEAGKSWARDGRFAAWALVPRNDPATLDMLAHCQTYRRDALVLPPGTTARDSVTYGVAAVFTPGAHRRKGYANHLLKLLHYILAPAAHLPPFPLAAWGAAPASALLLGDAEFSVLYSGIGREFYARCTKGEDAEGWVAQPLTCRTWTVPAEGDAEVEGGEWVLRADLAKVEAEMGKRMRRDVANTGDKTKTRVAILPNGCVAFQAHFSGNKDPQATNALFLPTDAAGERPFITYTTAWRKPDRPTRLIITHVGHTAHARVPFSVVLAAARREGCDEVEDWGDNGWDAEGATLDDDKHCPCIATYGLQDVEWEFMEEYGDFPPKATADVRAVTLRAEN